jgi:hypothetical protein
MDQHERRAEDQARAGDQLIDDVALVGQQRQQGAEQGAEQQQAGGEPADGLGGSARMSPPVSPAVGARCEGRPAQCVRGEGQHADHPRGAGPAPGSCRITGSSASHSWYRSSRVSAGSRRHARDTRYSPTRSACLSPLIVHLRGLAAPDGLARADAGPRAGRVPGGPPRCPRWSGGSTAAAAHHAGVGFPTWRPPVPAPPAGPVAGTRCRWAARPPSSGRSHTEGQRDRPETPGTPAPGVRSSSRALSYIYRLEVSASQSRPSRNLGLLRISG